MPVHPRDAPIDLAATCRAIGQMEIRGAARIGIQAVLALVRSMAAVAHSLGVLRWLAAASYKFTPDLPDAVPIEERGPQELTGGAAIPGVQVYNPIFDVTHAGQLRDDTKHPELRTALDKWGREEYRYGT